MSPAILTALLLHVAATAQVPVSDGEEVTVPVSQSGVTLQLPEFVRVVTPAQDYLVRPLTAPQGTPAQVPTAQAAAATDIRVFLVRPAKPSPAEQSVTFVMAEDRSVTVRFTPAGFGREESFIDLRWAKRLAPASRSRNGDGFLGAERALLLAMLRDEPAPGRKVVDQAVALTAYPMLEVKLLRTYNTDGLIGSVYTFRNRSEQTVHLNQTVLAVGKPNRAVLTQMDHSELRSCKEDSSSEPRGTGCVSAVRIVSRAGRVSGPGSLVVDGGATMPFVVVQAKEAKR